jgi:hypothetical protein
MPMPPTRQLCLYLLLTLSSSLAAQQPADPQPPVDPSRVDSLRWLAALHDRFGQVHDPVVRTYAKARLAALVCSQDKAAGTKQFRESFDDLRNLPDAAFDKSPVVLPVDTFGALWNLVAPPARNCNPDVTWYDASLDQRKNGEWLKGAIWLAEAPGLVNRNPERAAQLARAALSVSAGRGRQRFLVETSRRHEQSTPPPGVTAVSFGAPDMDLSSLVKVLIQLRVVAPDLSDGLFQLATSAVMASNAPSPMESGKLAAYLFPTETTVQFYDSFLAVLSQRGIPCRCELPSMPNFMAAELKGDKELATAFLGSAVRLLQNSQSSYEDPEGAFALAWQLAPKARELAPEYAGEFEGVLSIVEPLAGAGAAKIRARLGAAPNPRQVDYGTPAGDVAALTQSCSDFKAGRYAAASGGLSAVSDRSARAQVEALIQFAVQAISLPTSNAEPVLDRDIYPAGGAKRSLLYAAIAPAASNAAGALKAVALGLKDAEPLSAGQRACILPPLAMGALRAAPEQAVAILKQMVAAENAVAANADSSASAPEVRCRTTGPVELVNVQGGKLAFPLRAPGVDVFTISAFLEPAKAAEFGQLESAVLELHDETHLVDGLLALAKLRLSAPSH